MSNAPPNLVLFTLSTCPACAELKQRIAALPPSLQGTIFVEEDAMDAMHDKGIENVPAAMVAESGQVMTPEQTWQHVAALESMTQGAAAPTPPAQGPVQRLIEAASTPQGMLVMAGVAYLGYRHFQARGASGSAMAAATIEPIM